VVGCSENADQTAYKEAVAIMVMGKYIERTKLWEKGRITKYAYGMTNAYVIGWMWAKLYVNTNRMDRLIMLHLQIFTAIITLWRRYTAIITYRNVKLKQAVSAAERRRNATF